MIERMLVTVVSGMILLCIGMQYMLLCIPVFKKTEFNLICHNYAMRMENQSGLTAADLLELGQILDERGFYVLKLDAGSHYSYGQSMLLTVNARITVRRITPQFISQMFNINMKFQYQQYARG